MADSEEGGLGARRVRFKPGGKAGEGPLGPRPGFLSPGGKGGGEGGGDSGAYKNPLFAGSRSDPVRCGSPPGPPRRRPPSRWRACRRRCGAWPGAGSTSVGWA